MHTCIVIHCYFISSKHTHQCIIEFSCMIMQKAFLASVFLYDNHLLCLFYNKKFNIICLVVNHWKLLDIHIESYCAKYI